MTVDAVNFFVMDKQFPHNEFVDGIRNGSLILVINDEIGDGDNLCTRKHKTTLGVIKGGLFLLPFIAIITYSIYTHNWWFLCGIVVSWLALGLTILQDTKFTVLLMLINIGYWFYGGFHLDYFTFFSLVFIISSLSMKIQNEYDMLYVKRSLIEDVSLYHAAMENDKITLVRPPR